MTVVTSYDTLSMVPVVHHVIGLFLVRLPVDGLRVQGSAT